MLLLEEEAQLGAAGGALGGLDLERVASGRRPLPGLVGAGGARDDLDPIGDEVRAVEADAELTDDRDVLLRARLELLDEGGGPGPRDGAEVLDELGLGHADAGVFDHEHLGFGLDPQPDDELGLALEERRLGQRPEAQLVERVGRVRHELSKEDLLVRVERVDDEGQDPADLGLKGMRTHLASPSRVIVIERELEKPRSFAPGRAHVGRVRPAASRRGGGRGSGRRARRGHVERARPTSSARRPTSSASRPRRARAGRVEREAAHVEREAAHVEREAATSSARRPTSSASRHVEREPRPSSAVSSCRSRTP